MASPKSDGRMIRKDISNSDNFAALSPGAAVLFCMIIPHLNPYGKLNGGPGYLKDEICPKIGYLTYQNIPELMAEINQHTNMKWFEYDGRYWIHSLSFLTEHQKIDPKKLGADLLPDYSGTSSGLVLDQSPKSHPSNVNVNVNVKESTRARGEEKPDPDTAPLPGAGCLFEHFWGTFRQAMPRRFGKFLDEDKCHKYAAKQPARWPLWIIAAKNYAASREVADGAIMHPMKFLTRAYLNWQTPEEAITSGSGPPPDVLWMKTLEADEEAARKERAEKGPGKIGEAVNGELGNL